MGNRDHLRNCPWQEVTPSCSLLLKPPRVNRQPAGTCPSQVETKDQQQNLRPADCRSFGLAWWETLLKPPYLTRRIVRGPLILVVMACIHALPWSGSLPVRAEAPADTVEIRNSHFDITSSPRWKDDLPELAKWLEHVRVLGLNVLGFFPVMPVPVEFYGNLDEYRAAGCRGVPSEGEILQGFLCIVPDPAASEATAKALTRLYIRFAVRSETYGKAADWLTGGIENYLCGGFTPSLEVLARSPHTRIPSPMGSGIRDSHSVDATLPGVPTARPLQPTELDAQATLAVYYLQETGGEKTLSKLLGDIAGGKSWAEALQDAASLTPASFEDGWRKMGHEGIRSFTPPGEAQGKWTSTGIPGPHIPSPPQPGKPAQIRVAVGNYDLPATGQVDALLVVGGDASIHGTVTTRIVVMGGNLHLYSLSRVAGRINVVGGTLTIDADAVVKGTAEVSGLKWDPANIRSDRAALEVTIDRPIDVDFRLPGRAYILKEGSVTVPAGETVDAAIALGGGVDVSGSVRGRIVAVGGNAKLPAAPPEGLEVVAVNGRILVNGQSLDPYDRPPTSIEMRGFEADYTAPAQPGEDRIPIYLAIGDSAVASAETYDAILSVGGNCVISGKVYGGLIIGGDTIAAKGSTLTGPVWVCGGVINIRPGSNSKGLDMRDTTTPQKR